MKQCMRTNHTSNTSIINQSSPSMDTSNINSCFTITKSSTLTCWLNWWKNHWSRLNTIIISNNTKSIIIQDHIRKSKSYGQDPRRASCKRNWRSEDENSAELLNKLVGEKRNLMMGEENLSAVETFYYVEIHSNEMKRKSERKQRGISLSG